MTTANKFTILRLIFVLPFLAMLIFVASIDKEMQYSEIQISEKLQVFIASGILFILAMITDWIDGHIARKTNTVTTFGKLFDPLADKFMTTTAFVMLSVMKIVPVYLVVPMILRDIFVDGSRFIASGILFILAMITDWIDGHIARKTNTVTTFGKLFDPLADKFMTTTAFVMLSVMKIVPVYLVVPMILRDIFVDGSRVIAATNKKTVAANMWGKLKTVAQTLAIILAFFLAPIWSNNQNALNTFLYNIPSIIATLLSLVSGMIYFWKIKDFIKLK